MPDQPAAPDLGPYTSTETKTIEIHGPLKITLTTKLDASHVPETATVEGADAFMEALKPLAEIIIRKLDEIRRGQRSPSA